MKDEGRRKEFLAMIEEENRNAVISNLVETASVSPDNGVQLIIKKMYCKKDQGSPFMHARLEVIRFFRVGET